MFEILNLKRTEKLLNPRKAILNRSNYRLLLSAFTLLRTSAYVYMVLVMVFVYEDELKHFQKLLRKPYLMRPFYETSTT